MSEEQKESTDHTMDSWPDNVGRLCRNVYLYKGMEFCSGLLGVDEVTANCVTP